MEISVTETPPETTPAPEPVAVVVPAQPDAAVQLAQTVGELVATVGTLKEQLTEVRQLAESANSSARFAAETATEALTETLEPEPVTETPAITEVAAEVTPEPAVDVAAPRAERGWLRDLLV